MTPSAIEVPIATAIEELEKTRTQYMSDLDRVNDALGSLRQLTGTAAPTARKPKAARTVKVARPARKPRRGATAPALLVKAELIAKKSGLRAAVEATGIKYATLWRVAHKEGWKVAPSPRGPAVHETQAKAKTASKPMPGARICHKCHETARQDPCEGCGTPARKD